jgi:ABC-type multidrug transport system fused ATPase/permease subunit
MAAYWRLLGYIRGSRAGLLGALGVMLLGMLFELARPWPLKVIVDYGLSGLERPPWVQAVTALLPFADTTSGLVAWSVAALAIMVLAGATLAYLGTVLVVRICYSLVFRMARDLYAKLQRLSLAYHQRQSVGDLIQRMSQDVFSAHIAVSSVLLPMVISFCTLVGMFAIMLSIDLVMTLVALLIVPGLVGALALLAGPMDRATRARYDQQAGFMGFIERGLAGIKVAQGFARESYLQGEMEQRAMQFGAAYNRDVRTGELYKQLTVMVTGLATAAVLGIGAWRTLAGFVTIGDMLVFVSYLAALYGPLQAIATALGAAVQAGSQARRVFEVFDTPEEISEPDTPVLLDRIEGRVEFRGVSAGYLRPGAMGDRVEVLHDISFVANPGETVAIIGATGMGKSTLVSLISRFYDPFQGQVLVDGHDIRTLSLQQLRSNVGLVLQEPFLFPMSIASNIAFGLTDIDRERIVEAARIACADEFIRRLPHGYDSVLSEHGGGLSGGERQRISIARAVLKRCPILILDEPTSSLDARTEAQILTNLRDTAGQRTTFVISHRLSTIRRADRIFVLNEGRIVESGRHEELIARESVYHSLYRQQEVAAL